MSRKGGTRGGGCIKGMGANSMAMSGLGFTGLALCGCFHSSYSYTQLGLARKQSSDLVGPPFVAVVVRVMNLYRIGHLCEVW